MTQHLHDPKLTHGWTREDLLTDYRVAWEARATDEVEERWKSAGRIKFNILGAGQEIAQICAARQLRPGDWMRGYYRGLAEVLRVGGTTVDEILAQVLGNTEEGCDPASRGRMMGRHFGDRLVGADGELVDLRERVNRASDVSSTGSQMGPALGLALASKLFDRIPGLHEAHPTLSTGGGEVAHVSIGDASMAEGIALEAIHQAVVQRLPLVLSVYDNGYGISVPGERQIPHGSVSRALSGLAPGAPGESGLKILGPVSDWSYAEVRLAYEEAFRWVRETGNPALVHCRVTQPKGHSSSGDHRRYKDSDRLQWERDNDGIAHFGTWLVEQGVANREELESIRADAKAEVQAAAQRSWAAFHDPLEQLADEALDLMAQAAASIGAPAQVDPQLRSDRGDGTMLSRSAVQAATRRFLFATRADGAADGARQALLELIERVDAEARPRFGSHLYAEGSHSPCNAPLVAPVPEPDGSTDTGAHILAAGVATLMDADPRVVTFGEDTGRIGGVTTCSLGLQSGRSQVLPAIWDKSPALKRYVPDEGFGDARVWDTAIAEGTLVGTAAGLAVRGLRPIAEIQYHDYAVYALQQMVEEMACLRHRTAGGQECPAIVWCQGHRLLGMWHSGSPMGLFLTVPGLRVLVPRNAVQAVALYRAALLHGRDPVFVVVPLLDLYGKLPVPSNLDEICLPFGHSEVLREGEHVTIVTYGHCCMLALQAAELAHEHHGVSVEVVDLQTLNPLDLNDVARDSIAKTGRVLFLDEDYPNGAIAMVARTLLFERRVGGEQLIYSVDGVRTLTSPDHKPGYADDGDAFSKPQVHDILGEVLALWNDTAAASEPPISMF
ncbi:MAG: thiamine pyrophosphate-dependent enzyme [Planctomycetota bacterium]